MGWTLIVAYLGPDTMMPVASTVAAVAGGVLMFGRTIWGWMRRLVRREVVPSGAQSAAQRGRHLHSRQAATETVGTRPH